MLFRSALSGDHQEQKLRSAWDAAFVHPTDPANDTGLWLLRHELTTDVYRAVRVFENFGNLVGATVYNPAREFTGKTTPNPAPEMAKERGFDLAGDLDLLARTAEGSREYLAIEERLVALVPAVRERTCASSAISDQDLLNAICQPYLPLTVEPPLDSLAEAEQIRVLRGKLKPHIEESVTDSDLLGAARNPNGPLFVAGLCRIQVLYRNPAVPLGDALQFSPEVLGRSRVQATCWFDRWSEQKPRPADIEPNVALAA